MHQAAAQHSHRAKDEEKKKTHISSGAYSDDEQSLLFVTLRPIAHVLIQTSTTQGIITHKWNTYRTRALSRFIAKNMYLCNRDAQIKPIPR